MRAAGIVRLGRWGLGGWLLATTLGGAHAQAPSSAELPRLTGIVIAGPHRVAIFDSPPGQSISAEEGETVAAYTVRRIGPAGVQVEREGRKIVLALTQSAQPATPVDTGGVTFGRVVNPRRPPDD